MSLRRERKLRKAIQAELPSGNEIEQLLDETEYIIFPALSKNDEKAYSQYNLKLEQLEILVHDLLYSIQEKLDMDSKEEYPSPILIEMHDKLEEIADKRHEFLGGRILR